MLNNIYLTIIATTLMMATVALSVINLVTYRGRGRFLIGLTNLVLVAVSMTAFFALIHPWYFPALG